MLKRRICAYFLLMSMVSGCLAAFGGCKNKSQHSDSQVQSSVESNESSDSNNDSQESDSETESSESGSESGGDEGEEDKTLDNTVSRMSVQATSGEDFKVLQLTDLQIIDPSQQPAMPNVEVKSEYADRDACAFNQVRALVAETEPDYIVLTGDNVYGEFDHDGSNFMALVSLMESFQIPWSLVYGNHDGEMYPGKGMQWQSEYLLENTEYCKFAIGDTYYETEGYGNYVVDIMDGKDVRGSLMMMDTHGCRRELAQGIYENQIEWYEAAIREVSEDQYGEFDSATGKVVPSYAFFHIAMPQFDMAMNTLYGGVNGVGEVGENDKGDFGEALEPAAAFSDTYGFWNKIQELQSTKGIFVGHTHINNASILYNGVRLTYGTKTGIYDYHEGDMQGGKLLTINAQGEVSVKEVPYDISQDVPNIGGSTLPPNEGEVPENVIAVKAKELTETDWATCNALPMTALSEGTQGATGTVKMLATGTRLYFRMEVTDSTRFENDRPSFTITIGGKTQSARGKYCVSWLADWKKDFGDKVLYEEQYKNGVYTLTLGFDLAEYAVLGAHVAVEFTHSDAQTSSNDWADSTTAYPHAIGFTGLLYLGAYSEEDPVANLGEKPEQPPQPDTPVITPGPDNVDLKIVVKNLTSYPTEEDWENATAYAMLPNNGSIDGATGTVKLLTYDGKLFYRVEVEDATTDINCDGVYIWLGTDEKRFESRGNYDEWLSHIRNDLGSPILFEMSTTAASKNDYVAGKYTFTQAFDLEAAGLYAEGGQVRLILKHRDSRSPWEPWRDGDYDHTIYFSQTITFATEE